MATDIVADAFRTRPTTNFVPVGHVPLNKTHLGPSERRIAHSNALALLDGTRAATSAPTPNTVRPSGDRSVVMTRVTSAKRPNRGRAIGLGRIRTGAFTRSSPVRLPGLPILAATRVPQGQVQVRTLMSTRITFMTVGRILILVTLVVQVGVSTTTKALLGSQRPNAEAQQDPNTKAFSRGAIAVGHYGGSIATRVSVQGPSPPIQPIPCPTKAMYADATLPNQCRVSIRALAPHIAFYAIARPVALAFIWSGALVTVHHQRHLSSAFLLSC